MLSTNSSVVSVFAFVCVFFASTAQRCLRPEDRTIYWQEARKLQVTDLLRQVAHHLRLVFEVSHDRVSSFSKHVFHRFRRPHVGSI